MSNQNSFERVAKHVLTLFLCSPICLTIFGQAPHVPPEISITKTLESHFSEGFTFVHREVEVEMTSDSLTYQFYNAKITWEKDSLFLSYVQKIKGNGPLVTVEKIEQAIPIPCIEEVDTFNFTFGGTDTFEPHLSYIGFWMEHENCSKMNVYGIDPAIWNTGSEVDSDYELLQTDHPYVARFPVILPESSLHRLRKDVMALQKQKK